MTVLHRAAASQDKDPAKYLIEKYDMDVNIKDNDGKTVLHCAAKVGNKSLVKYLLTRDDVDINQEDNSQMTALDYAIYEGKYRIVKYLLKRNDLKLGECAYGSKAFRYALLGDEEMVANLFLDYPGIDINKKDDDGITVSHIAASGMGIVKKNEAILQKLLMREDILVNATDNGNSTPLHIAAFFGDSKIISYFLNDPRVDVHAKIHRDNKDLVIDHSKTYNVIFNWMKIRSPMHNPLYKQPDFYGIIRSKYGSSRERGLRIRQNTRDIDLNVNNINGMTALHIAAAAGNENVVKLFLNRIDIDVNQTTDDGSTLIHMAAMAPNKGVLEYLMKNTSIDINQRAKDGSTALHRAAAIGNTASVKCLLKNENINMKILDNQGRSALHLAATSDHKELVELLIPYYNANQTTADGGTLIHMAAMSCQTNDVLLYLINVVGMDINAKDNYGRTALHRAITQGKGNELSIVKLIENKNIDINAKDSHGRTALHRVALLAKNSDGTVSHKYTYNYANYLILHKNIQVNIQDADGNTALHLAAANGNRNIMEAIFSKKRINNLEPFDISIKNNNGDTPLDIAKSNGYFNIYNIMIQGYEIDKRIIPIKLL